MQFSYFCTTKLPLEIPNHIRRIKIEKNWPAQRTSESISPLEHIMTICTRNTKTLSVILH